MLSVGQRDPGSQTSGSCVFIFVFRWLCVGAASVFSLFLDTSTDVSLNRPAQKTCSVCYQGQFVSGCFLFRVSGLTILSEVSGEKKEMVSFCLLCRFVVVLLRC